MGEIWWLQDSILLCHGRDLQRRNQRLVGRWGERLSEQLQI